MSALEFAALVLAAIGPLLALARLLRLPPTLLLVAAGVGSTFLPGLPAVRVEPEAMFALALPPLVYAGTVRASVHLLRSALLPGVLVGAAVAAATVPAVAVAARWLLPGLDWAPALLLGALAALFDTRLFEEAQGRPRVPRAVADALKAREMTARLLALGTFFSVLAAAGPDAPPAGGLPEALPAFALDLFGGLAAGLAVGAALGWAVVRLRERVRPAPVEIAVSLATPYLGYLAAERLGLPMVAVLMAAALTVTALRVDADTGEAHASSEARIAAASFWEEVGLLVSSVLFFLAGRALPEALAGLGTWPVWQTAGAAAALLALVLGVQFAGAFASTALLPASAWRRAGPAPGAGSRGGAAVRARLLASGVMAWSATRSVIALVAALSLPPSLADRDLLLVLASLLVLGSVLLQGFTLRAAVRAADLGDEAEARGEEERAARAAREAAEAEPDEERRHDAARRALLALRREDRVGDEALRKALRGLDFRDRAEEGTAAALPGAGPPNP